MSDKYIEIFNETLLVSVERILNKEIIKTHMVVDVVPIGGNKHIVKLSERICPLTDEEIAETYGK